MQSAKRHLISQAVQNKKQKLDAGKLNETTLFLKLSALFHLLTFPPSRYIMLDNGLRALLISDYSGPAASEDEDSDGEDEGEEEEEDDESGDETEEESEEDGDEEDSHGDGEDDDDEGKKKKGNAEKQVPLGFF